MTDCECHTADMGRRQTPWHQFSDEERSTGVSVNGIVRVDTSTRLACLHGLSMDAEVLAAGSGQVQNPLGAARDQELVAERAWQRRFMLHWRSRCKDADGFDSRGEGEADGDIGGHKYIEDGQH